MKSKIQILVLAALVLTLLPGCGALSGLFGKSGEEIESTPQTMAYEGIESMNKGNYKTAAETFSNLKDRYPYSRYAILAELKLGDVLYLEKNYIEAAAAYADFERLHPKNEAVPYVIYQQGMCYFVQMSTPDRDPIPSVNAIQTFVRLQDLYPDSQYASMANARLVEAQNILAGHEFFVGEFYFKMDAYKAALGRFMSLIKNYPDTGYHGRALDYIKICRIKIAEKEAEAKAEAADESEKKKKKKKEFTDKQLSPEGDISVPRENIPF